MFENIVLPLQLQDFITLFMGLVVEAFPFVILGGLVSALVAIFLTPDVVKKIVPENSFLSHGVIAVTGIFMPVCECGNIPVVRRMIANGFTPAQSITFLLAAPIINPITLWSTVEAFGWDSGIPQIRMVSAYFIAVGVGLIFSLAKNQMGMLNERFYELHCKIDDSGHHHHDHDHDESDSDHMLSHQPDYQGGALLKRIVTLDPKAIGYFFRRIANVFQDEFMAVMPALIIGAMLAAGIRVFLPADVLVSLAINPIISVLVMMLLAFVISICANVDAFFALSYANTFTVGSVLSFLVFGPMIDMKILTMLLNVFKVRVLIMMTALVTLSSILLGLLVNWLY